jgi:hypothetical protein
LLSTPRTDPGERYSRTGLPPWVINGEAHKQLLVHDQPSGTRFPGAEAGTCVALPCSPWSSSLAPPAPPPVAQVCSPASWLLRRGLTSLARASSASTPRLPVRTARKQLKRSSKRSPGSRPKSVRTCQGLRPRRAAQALALSRLCVLPSAKSDSVGTLNCRVLSRLDGWPAGSPVNASQRTSRCATHDSGPVWFAIPSLFGTFTFSLCRFSRRTTLYSLSISRRTSVQFFTNGGVTPITWPINKVFRAPVWAERSVPRLPRSLEHVIHKCTIAQRDTPYFGNSLRSFFSRSTSIVNCSGSRFAKAS